MYRKQFPRQIQCVIDRLYKETLEIDQASRRAASARGLNNDGDPGFYNAMADARMPVAPEFGNLMYILSRCSGARHIVEFGTSFGMSTLYMAAALRENGGGKIITTELISTKAETARRNLREAGLEDLVDIRVGDALKTLSGDSESIDVILLDADKNLYLDILKLLEPRLKSGGLVISDRADLGGGDGDRARAYLSYMDDAKNGYKYSSISSQVLGMWFSHDIAIRD